MPNNLSVCDEDVYNNLYKTHAESLRNHLYFKFGNLKQAEDVVQESFIKLWRKCNSIIYDNAVGFLYTASKNMFIDSIRKNKVVLKFKKSYTETQDNEDPYFHLRTKEFQEKIESTIAGLPEKQREAFLLNRIEKLTFKEIANKLEISQTAVENRIAKALIKLKEITELQKRKF
ncbi:RNA polymerase sigma factor [Cellulophaga baltica]|uniref:RNA polymerase sigma factor n=1 Tax=Cellulophaga TaxID=104264 RepID=UPI001C07B47E|nr:MULTISPECIES: RNA polymerase sigma factor [Cellulophaga]MBU2996342.1 RNA polymerase sigma factor [Cellulophaga baltica]MDO6767737.1 RNA polymerase sigma factor [Cellulophaga sp. 1_MG-2023]